MAEKVPINIFISHCAEDAAYLKNLRNLLEKKGYKVRDSSIDERDPNNAKHPEYIKTLIRPKIDWAGRILVLVGHETHKKNWVNWEIEYANKYGDKRIVGIFLRGGTDSDIPDNLKKYGDCLVPWNSDKIEAAIEGEIEGEENWLDPNGVLIPGFWPRNRSKC
jgi:hypothetical protein